MVNIKATVRDFINENYLFNEDVHLKDDTSFLDEGIIDSTGVLELIGFLEETFGITIEDDEMVPENLDSLSNIAAFIAKKM